RRGRRSRLDWDPLGGGRIDQLRRALRWINLTLVQQGVWPLLAIVAAAPAEPAGALPWPWWAARAGAPAAAAVLALTYVWQRPEQRPRPRDEPAADAGSMARSQAKIALIGVALCVAALRIALGPAAPALKTLLFGAADVAAYHTINFGVVAGANSDREAAGWQAVALFGLSWGLGRLFLAALAEPPAALPIVFIGGWAAGALVGALALGLRRWPGGWAAAVATHWLLIYGIAAFVG
ncbi:MAG TPA: hypothetical protein VFI22_01965, partial [Thermomicrobiales bacterium]|nr:hypothetical protein [Thermomicrobiales bacterium]